MFLQSFHFICVMVKLQQPQMQFLFHGCVGIIGHQYPKLSPCQIHRFLSSHILIAAQKNLQPRLHLLKRQDPTQEFPGYHQLLYGVFRAFYKAIPPGIFKHDGISAAVQCNPRVFFRQYIFGRIHVAGLVHIHLLKPLILHLEQMGKEKLRKLPAD